jgi:hypothetical protein
MGARVLNLHDDENLFHFAMFRGENGFIHLEKNGLIFGKEKGEVEHTISIKNIVNVELEENNNDQFLTIHTNDKKYQYQMSSDEEEKVKDEGLYFAIKGLLLSEAEIQSFISNQVCLKNIECKKMFNNFIIAHILEKEGMLRHNEKFEGALYGRYCPDFTNHYYGLLIATNQRIFFFDREKQRASLERKAINNFNIIKSFGEYSDEYGRSHYNLEFNQSSFIVDILTKRAIKIEMFYRLIEPEKQLDWSF